MIAAAAIAQQVHGYEGGHGLLYSTLKLNRVDQDLVDRLSDIAGPLRPSEIFRPYLTCYPLPSGDQYVIARTWQDLDTPRAGCVLTRSLFVPMEEWEISARLPEIAKTIVRPTRVDLAGLRGNSRESSDLIALPPTGLPELVEALFLESRRPIVVFDSPEAEFITLRIISALWPSKRRTFAACTWCLTPRRLKDRDFDLVFAPSDARSRFSDWGGRRIEGKGPSQGRHRWTRTLVDTIFGRVQRDLLSWDELGILEADKVGDEGILRLSLMWRELEAKAQSTPNAVLGMLDILNSNSMQPGAAQLRLEPLVKRAIDVARVSQPADAAWRFYINLLGKFTQRSPSRKTLRELRNAAAILTAENTASAVLLLREIDALDRDLPAVLAAGIGDGIASSGFCSGEHFQPSDIGRRNILRFLAFSKRFSKSVAAAVRDCPEIWANASVSALDGPDVDLVKRARRNLLPAMNSGIHSILLGPLLNEVSPNELFVAVRTIAKTTRFEFAEFDRPIVNAARTEQAARRLREAIIEAPESLNSSRLLANALRLAPHDVEWLLTAANQHRASEVLANLIGTSEDAAIQTLMRDSAVGNAVIEAMMNEPWRFAPTIFRLMRFGHADVEIFVNTGLHILDNLQDPEKERLRGDIVRRALGERQSSSTSIDIVRILDELTEEIDAADLVVLLTQPHANLELIRTNLAALTNCRIDVRRKIAPRVDQLTARLTSRGTHAFDQTGYSLWAEVIRQSASYSSQSHLNACIEALSYALKQPRWPLSSLIRATFPTVYRQLLESKGESDFEFLPSLLRLPLAFFSDWDRAKKARRELVDAYMSSSWPPGDLVLTALDAGIDQQVLGRVSHSRDGKLYLDNIWADIDSNRLEIRERTSVRDALETYKKNPRISEWD